MSEPLEALVEQLGAIALEPSLELPEQLAQQLARREELLIAIGRADLSQLAPALRSQLKERLQQVLLRDHAVRDELEQLRAEAQAALAQLTPSRAAVRGYSEVLAESPASTRRLG